MSICYAPLNRLVSVYRSALRETIFNLILFLLVCFHFLLVSLFLLADSSEQTRKKMVHSFWQVNSMLQHQFNLAICASMTVGGARARSFSLLLLPHHHFGHAFIGPYGVQSAINSILRLMAMIQTAQVIVTNCTFYMLVLRNPFSNSLAIGALKHLSHCNIYIFAQLV